MSHLSQKTAIVTGGVQSRPGQTAFTLMLCRPSEKASDWVRLIAAAFDAE